MISNSDAVVTTLQRAKEHLAEHGWWRGTRYPSPSGPRGYAAVCAVEALHARDIPLLVLLSAFDALRATTGDAHRVIIDHNDHCLTSLADALDWFDRAIRYAKEQPS